MTISESIVLKTRDDMPKWLFGNVLRTLYLKGFRGFGSTCKQSETLPQDELVEDKCTSGFGSTCELTETLAKDIEVVEDTSNQGVYYSDGLVSVDAQQNLIQVTVYSASDLSLDVEQDEKVTAYSASDLSLDVEQDEKVADGSLRRRIDEQEQKEVSKNHDRLKPEILYVPYRNNAAKPFISVIFICMLCVLPGTIAFKAHLGYNQFDNVLGKPGRSPLPNESIIVPDANNFQAHSKPQPAQQNANEEVNKARIGHGLFGQAKVGGKNGDFKKQTEKSRKIREVEEAITNKKGEPQQEVKTERKMVALTPSLRDITRDKYEIFEHIVTRKGTLSIKIRHYPDEKVCSLTIITNMTTTEYTSKEEQDGNIIVERRDTFCIFHFKNFTLESYVNTTVYADADLRRILHPDLFLNRLNDRIAVYQTNDQEGTVRISTVGENVQCSIQPTNVVEKISEERGNIETTLYIKYKKAGVCFYNINCNMSGFIHSITHEVENCSAEPTATTQLLSHSGVTDHSTSTTTDSTTTPSNITTTKPSNRDGTSSKHNKATNIALVVFGVLVVIALTVLYIMKKKKINHCPRIIIYHFPMLCRPATNTDNDTPEDRLGDHTQKPLRKPESNDSGIELAGQSTVFLPDN